MEESTVRLQNVTLVWGKFAAMIGINLKTNCQALTL